MTQPTPHTNPPVQPPQNAYSRKGNITQVGRDMNNSNNSSILILTLTVLGGMVALGVVFGRGIGTQVNQPQLSAPIAPAAPASSSSKP
jgi:hypothetical protein